MLARVQLWLVCPSQSDAVTVRDAVATKVATKVLRVTHSDVAAVLHRGQWVVAADVSFRVRLDADDVFADAQSRWSGGALRNRISVGSWARLHVCSHADGEPPPWPSCQEIELQLATKAA